jgi:hypothetical protein
MSEENGNIEEQPNTDEIVEPSPTPEADPKPEGQEEASATETPEEPKKPNKVQERINQLTREKYEERQKTAELEKRVKELESQTKPTEESELVVPKEDDFENHSDFVQAQSDYIAEKAARAASERVAATHKANTESDLANQRQKELESKKAVFDASVAEKKGNFQDFESIAYGHEFMDLDLAEQIFDMDKGPEVAYHLGSHLDEAERIFALNPVQRARELTKLEFQVEAVKPKKVSDAPDPIEPLGSNEVVEQDPDKMSADEWQQWEYDRMRAANKV